MLKLLKILIENGVATQRESPKELDEVARGLPKVRVGEPCLADLCNACTAVCPADSIKVIPQNGSGTGRVELDRGACIGCGYCVEVCPTQVLAPDRSVETAVATRAELIQTNQPEGDKQSAVDGDNDSLSRLFRKSLAVRVVSTGCSATDLEVSASGNPIFDAERFGVHVVASPRMADALAVTGPVPKGMEQPLIRTFEAMSEPRLVIAVGTCAISGGLHRNGYTSANGVDRVLPVDIYIPGCPPHPWNIIYGFKLAMRNLPKRK